MLNKSSIYRNVPFLLVSVSLLLTILAWLVFAPDFFANVDEHNYIRSSWLLSQSQSLTMDSTKALGGFPNHLDEHVSKYNLGNSIWLLPVASLGLQMSFFWSLLTYLGLVVICRLILKKLNLSQVWLIGLILFPPLIFYSRTLLSELPAALFFALSYFSYLMLNTARRYWLLLGISLGFLVLLRYNFALWAVLVCLKIAYDAYKSQQLGVHLRQARWMVLGALPWLAAFLFINITLYGSIVSSGYKFSGEESIDLTLIVSRLPAYIILLNLLYPLQFIALIWSKLPLKGILAGFSVVMMLFYSVAGGYLFEGQPTDLIAGIRFFFPIMPVLLTHYFHVLQTIWEGLKSRFTGKADVIRWILISISVTGLSAVTILLNFQHQQFLSSREEIFNSISSLASLDSSELYVGTEDDFIYLGEMFGNFATDDAYIVVDSFKLSPENFAGQYNHTYIFEFDYPSRPDRPTDEMLKYIAELKSEDKLSLVDTGEYYKIYEYE